MRPKSLHFLSICYLVFSALALSSGVAGPTKQRRIDYDPDARADVVDVKVIDPSASNGSKVILASTYRLYFTNQSQADLAMGEVPSDTFDIPTTFVLFNGNPVRLIAGPKKMEVSPGHWRIIAIYESTQTGERAIVSSLDNLSKNGAHAVLLYRAFPQKIPQNPAGIRRLYDGILDDPDTVNSCNHFLSAQGTAVIQPPSYASLMDAYIRNPNRTEPQKISFRSTDYEKELLASLRAAGAPAENSEILEYLEKAYPIHKSIELPEDLLTITERYPFDFEIMRHFHPTHRSLFFSSKMTDRLGNLLDLVDYEDREAIDRARLLELAATLEDPEILFKITHLWARIFPGDLRLYSLWNRPTDTTHSHLAQLLALSALTALGLSADTHLPSLLDCTLKNFSKKRFEPLPRWVWFYRLIEFHNLKSGKTSAPLPNLNSLEEFITFYSGMSDQDLARARTALMEKNCADFLAPPRRSQKK